MNAFFAALVLSGATLAAQTAAKDSLAAHGTLVGILPTIMVKTAHIGHATQTLVLKPLMPAQHATEIMESYFASLDLRSRGLNDLQSDLSVRGSTFDQVHVVVDGIPFTDPQTGHHSAILPIPIEAIQEITVLPSGGSYRYGPFAFAGVVELRSLDARSGRGYASASTGAFGYTRAAGGVPLRRTADRKSVV